jgi:hypothetical protein
MKTTLHKPIRTLGTHVALHGSEVGNVLGSLQDAQKSALEAFRLGKLPTSHGSGPTERKNFYGYDCVVLSCEGSDIDGNCIPTIACTEGGPGAASVE